MSSNRRSFFKATLATGLALLTRRVNANPKLSVQHIEYGWETRTETFPITFEGSGGTETKEYCVAVYTPVPRLVISYSDGTQAVFVGTVEVDAGLNFLQHTERGKWSVGLLQHPLNSAEVGNSK